MFDAKRFEEYLRLAANVIDDACDELNKAEPGEIDPPGDGYLMAKLHIAQTLIEGELPEMKQAALIAAASAGLDLGGE